MKALKLQRSNEWLKKCRDQQFIFSLFQLDASVAQRQSFWLENSFPLVVWVRIPPGEKTLLLLLRLGFTNNSNNSALCSKSEVMLLQGHDHCLNITGWLCPKNTIDWIDRSWMRNYKNVQKDNTTKNILLQGQMVYKKIFWSFAIRFHMYHQ